MGRNVTAGRTGNSALRGALGALLTTTALSTAALLAGAAVSPAAAATWQLGGAATLYNDAANWDNTNVPDAAGETAVFNGGGSTTVDLSAGLYSPNSWAISGGTSYTFQNGSVSLLGAGLTNTSTVGQTVNVAIGGALATVTQNGAGTMTLGVANTYGGLTTVTAGQLTASVAGALGLGTGSVTVNGGTLDLGGASHSKLNGSMSSGTIQNGTLALAGTYTQSGGSIAATGVVTAVGAQTLSGGSIDGSLNGIGAVTVTANTTTVTGSISNTTSVTINAAGTLSVSGAGSVATAGGVANAGTLNLVNGGDVTATINNTNVLSVTGAGGSTVSGLITNSGTMSVGSGAGLTASAGIAHNAGTLTNDGAITGTITSAATFNNNAAGTVSGLVTINSSTTTNAGTLNGGVTTAGTGVLTTTGTVNNGITNGNVVNANGGTINGPIANSATFNIGGGAVTGTGLFANLTAGSRLLVNTGSYTLTGSINNSGTNAGGGILVAAGASLTASGIVNNAGATIVNNGTITDDLDNAGAVTNNAGAIYNATVNSNTGAGVITNAAGGTWNGNVTTNAATINNLGTWNTTGGGTINNTAGTLNSNAATSIINGNVANGAAFNVQGQLNGNLNNTGTTTLVGALTGIGALTNDGALQLAGNSLTVGSLNSTGAAGVINNGAAGAATFTVGSSNTNTTYAGAFTNTGGALGVTKVGTGTLTLTGANTNTGPFNINGGILAISGGNAIGNATPVNIAAAGTLQVLTSETVGATSNLGLINMQNGATTETLTTATYAGGGQINMDVNLGPGGGTGDQLAVAGAGGTSGVTTINFNNTAATVALNPDIKVVDTNGVVAGTDFQAAGLPPAVGLVQVSLQRKGDDWFVVSAPNLAATGGVIGNITVVQSTLGAIVNRPSSPFVSGLAADVEPNHCGPGVWARETGGAVNASSTTTSPGLPGAVANVSLVYSGTQFGLDLACFNVKESGVDVAAGMIGGGNMGNASQAVPNGGTTTSTFAQGYGGAYATFAKGPFSADIQARADFTTFTFNNPAIQLSNTTLNTLRTTVSGSASYAISMNDIALVPTVGFSASRTTSSTLTFTSGQQLTPAPSLSLIGFAGGTIAKTFVLPDEVSAAQPFATATVYNDFAAYPTATFLDPSTGQSQVLTSSHLGTIGELSVGANFFHVFEAAAGKPRQVNATVRVDTRFNNVLIGAGVTGQLRAQF